MAPIGSGARLRRSDIDEDFIVRLWKWYEESYNLHPSFGVGSSIIFELMQKAAFNSVPSPFATTWPHGHERRHVVQAALVTRPENSLQEVEAIASEQFRGRQVRLVQGTTFMANTLRLFCMTGTIDMSQVYGQNWQRLLRVSSKYDPDNRFNTTMNSSRQ